MSICWNKVPSRFEDGRHLEMVAGARAAGYSIADGTRAVSQGSPGDVLLTWNLHGKDAEALAFEAKGGTVLVAEEGYTRYLHDTPHFALARGGHNGSGDWRCGGPERWASLGLPVRPWRTTGTHVLVCGQRGIGSQEMASPPGWHDRIAETLRTHTDRPIVVRPHPGRNKAAAVPVAEQLEDAWAVVVWSSAVAVRALLMGIPVYYDAPHHVLGDALQRDIALVDTPSYPDRLPALERMAWAQWSLKELRNGEPFMRLRR